MNIVKETNVKPDIVKICKQSKSIIVYVMKKGIIGNLWNFDMSINTIVYVINQVAVMNNLYGTVKGVYVRHKNVVYFNLGRNGMNNSSCV